MAWKLRKDKLQSEGPSEEAGSEQIALDGETVTPVPPASGSVDENQERVSLDDLPSLSHPFILQDAEPDAPPAENEPSSHAAVAEAGKTHNLSAEPSFTDEPISISPFVPYQPDAPETPPDPIVMGSHTTIDRDEAAPNFVIAETDSGIPRVSPFIVDGPQPTEETASEAAVLVVRIGSLSANYPLTKEVTLIGRPDSATQSYPDIEIDLDDAVSRRHAEIRLRDGAYYLVDLMSTNGTLLNGERLEAYQEYRLEHGDRFHLGDRTEIIFE